MGGFSKELSPTQQDINRYIEKMIAVHNKATIVQMSDNFDDNVADDTYKYNNFDEFKEQNLGIGYLKIQAFTARRAYPVENAIVEISKNFKGNSYIVGRYITDLQGQTENIALPTKSKELSKIPSNEKPFASYNVKVSREPFVEMNFVNTPIFADVVSLQVADLVPIATSNGATSFDIMQREPTDL